MKQRRLKTVIWGLVVLCVSLGVTSQAWAALQISINQSADSAIPIAIAPFGSQDGTLPVDVAKVAGTDLASTGLFKMFPRQDMLAKPSKPEQVDYANWRTIGVDNLVIGNVKPDGKGGYQITMNLMDIPRGQSVASYQITASGNHLRDAAHTVANIIYQQFIGKKGYFRSRIAYVTVTGRTLGNREFRLVTTGYDGSHPRLVYKSSDPIMSPAWSPDGSKLAYVAFNVYKGLSNVRVVNLKTGSTRTISSSGGVNGAPAWSPDGSKLALAKSTNGNTNIYVYNLASGQMRQLTHSSAIDTGPAWSPDGRTIAFTSSRGGQPQIYEMSSDGGQVQRLTYRGKSNRRPRFSPDGKQIVMVRQSDQGYRIALMDLANNNVRILSDGPSDDSPCFSPNGQAVLYAQEGGHNALVAVSINADTKTTLSQAGEVHSPAWGPFQH